ncbi:MAG: M16 family metallopeptidase [Vicinamibacterales bacterium]
MNDRRRRGLEPMRVVLDNHAVAIAKEAHATPAVTVVASVAAGSSADPLEAPGTAHLLSRSLDRGTTRRSAEQIAEELDSRGVSLTSAVNRHSTSLWCTVLTEDLEPMLDLLADVIADPSLPDKEVEARKGEAVTAILQDEDSPAAVASERLLVLLYTDGHPYGRRLKGSVETVRGLDRSNLASFHRDCFAPSNLTVTVVGDVEARRAVDLVDRAFGTWRRKAVAWPALPPVAAPQVRQRLVIPMMAKAQADIACGLVTIRQTDPECHAFAVLNNILGQYGIGGRLGDSIREKQGMAYYVFSSLEASYEPGPLVIRAGVDPANVDRALSSIEHELETISRDGVTESELRESKRHLAGSLPRMLETNDGIASFLQFAEEFGLGTDYDARLPSLIGEVTLEEVNRLAREFLSPDRAVAVVAGPYGEAEQRGPAAQRIAAARR